jgi:putative transposase
MLSTQLNERLTEIGVEPSVGSVGDSYDNAMAESVIGLFNAEVIYARGPWRSCHSAQPVVSLPHRHCL